MKEYSYFVRDDGELHVIERTREYSWQTGEVVQDRVIDAEVDPRWLNELFDLYRNNRREKPSG